MEMGGAIYVDYESRLALYDVTILYNAAHVRGYSSRGGDGGAIFIGLDSLLIGERVHFVGNVAGSEGGAIYSDEGRLRLIDSVLEDNSSAKSGGAIFTGSGRDTLLRTTILGNWAGLSGGGIQNLGIYGGGMEIIDSLIEGNETDGSGGGIYNTGNITVSGTTIRGNSSSVGGGLYSNQIVYPAVIDPITLTDSMIEENVASDGGAAIVNLTSATILRSTIRNNQEGGILNSGLLSIQDSTISNNSIVGHDGAVIGGAAFWNEEGGSATLSNVTISGNRISRGHGAALFTEGGIYLQFVTLFGNEGVGLAKASSGTFNIRNSILIHNVEHNCVSGINSAGHNLFDDGTCGYDPELDDILWPPLGDILGDLADNGGPTFTHALLPGSPAIDAAGIDCRATDQRGVVRPQGLACDMGAFELEVLTTGTDEDTMGTDEDTMGTDEDISPGSIIETPTPTPTPSTTIATFTKNTNCRRGPGTTYGVVTSLLEGQEVLLEGRNTDNSWWWALLPQSTAHCWVSDSTVDISGPVAELALIAAPPTPTSTPQTPTPKPSPPAAPTKLTISAKVCNESVYSVTLGWTDNAGNEDGYRVYRDGQLIATLGANTSSYTDNPPGSGPYTYGVEAFNAVGSSQGPTVQEGGCIF